MPQIAAAVSGVTGLLGGIIGSQIGRAVLGYVASSVLSSVAARLLQPSAEQKNAQAGSGTQINETGSLAPIPLVYGKGRIAPNRVYVGTSNNDVGADGNEEHLQVIYTISNNTLLGAKCIYLNGEKVGEFTKPNETNGYIDNYIYPGTTPQNDVDGLGTLGGEINGFTLDSAYVNRVSQNYSISLTSADIGFDLYTGENFQLASQSFIDSANDSLVNSDFRGAGWAGNAGNSCSYIYMRLKYHEALYSTGIPTLSLDVWGEAHIDEFVNPNDTTQTFKEKLIADVAVDPDLTLTDNGDFDRLGAVQIIDYLIHDYGRNLDPTELDFDSFLEVAKLQLENSIFSDGQIDPNQTIMQNLNLLQANNLCTLIRSDGKYKLKYIAPESTIYTGSTYTFDEDNILGDWNISIGDVTTDYDIARVEFYNEAVDYQADKITVYDSAINLDSEFNPNNSKAILDLTLPFTNNKDEAKYLATVLMEMSKFDKVVSFKTTMEALQLEPYDPVYITHSLPGWTNEKFLVKEMTLNADSTIDVTLIEYPDIYPLTLVDERSDFGDIPAPQLTANFISAPASTGNSTSYILAVTTALDTEDLLLVIVEATENSNTEDCIATNVTFDGTNMDIVGTHQLDGVSYARSIGHTVCTLTNTSKTSASYNIGITLPNEAEGCQVSVWRITGGNALYQASVDSVNKETYVGNEGDTFTIAHTDTINIPAGGVLCYLYGSIDDTRAITTTTSGYTITEDHDTGLNGTRTSAGHSTAEYVARTGADLIHKTTSEVVTNWPRLSTAVIIR
jgi:acyl carrier protein